MNNTKTAESFSLSTPDWVTSLVAWAKADIADWHSRSFFNIFGWIVDKGDAMLLVVGVVVAIVILFFVGVGLLDPDKPEQPRRRPGLD